MPFYPLNYYAPSFYQYTLLPIPYFPALINISHTWTILSSILKKGILCRWIHRDSFNFEWSNTIREIQSKHRLEKLSSSPAFYAILFRLFKRPYQINKQSSLSIGHIWFDTKFYNHFLCWYLFYFIRLCWEFILKKKKKKDYAENWENLKHFNVNYYLPFIY